MTTKEKINAILGRLYWFYNIDMEDVKNQTYYLKLLKELEKLIKKLEDF